MEKMSISLIANLFGAIVTVALATTLVAPKSQTAQVVKAFGGAFSDSLRAAMGR